MTGSSIRGKPYCNSRTTIRMLKSFFPDEGALVMDLELLNTGISGHTKRDLLARFDRDAAFKP